VDVFPRMRGSTTATSGGGWCGAPGPCTWADNFRVISRYTRTRNISHQNWQSPVDGNDLCGRHTRGRTVASPSTLARSSYISYYGSTHEPTPWPPRPPRCNPLTRLTRRGKKPARSKNCIAAKSSFKRVGV